MLISVFIYSIIFNQSFFNHFLQLVNSFLCLFVLPLTAEFTYVFIVFLYFLSEMFHVQLYLFTKLFLVISLFVHSFISVSHFFINSFFFHFLSFIYSYFDIYLFHDFFLLLFFIVELFLIELNWWNFSRFSAKGMSGSAGKQVKLIFLYLINVSFVIPLSCIYWQLNDSLKSFKFNSCLR